MWLTIAYSLIYAVNSVPVIAFAFETANCVFAAMLAWCLRTFVDIWCKNKNKSSLLS